VPFGLAAVLVGSALVPFGLAMLRVGLSEL
jgi:hypothetical protein